MKNSISIMFGTLGFIVSSCAQGDGVPANVNTAFNTKFPEAKAVKWDKESDKEWEAEFKLNGTACSANFDMDGVWLVTETEIKTGNLPQAIKDVLTSKFEGYKLESAEKLVKPDFSGYEVEIEKGEKMIELIMDEDGKIITKEMIEEGDEKEEQ